MPIQFLEGTKVAFPGQKGSGQHRMMNGRKATVAIKAGLFVAPAGPDTCKLPTAATDVTNDFGGVAELLVDRVANANGFEYQIGDYVGAVRKGLIAVVTEEDVVDGDPAFVRFASGSGGTQLGAFRNDADSATAAALPRARFYGSWTAGVALLEMI